MGTFPQFCGEGADFELDTPFLGSPRRGDGGHLSQLRSINFAVFFSAVRETFNILLAEEIKIVRSECGL